jgi:hypothetical protein
MKRLIPALLLLTLLLGACSSGSSSAPADATQPPAATDPATAPATAPAAAEPGSTEQATATREAVLSDVENDVTARASAEGEFIAATNGMSITSGGALQTGENGRVRLDLNPEGTIVRVGPNSSFTLPELTETEGKPKTTISLLFGKIFVLLKGGSLDVETPSGVASVRGSLLSVEYDEEKQRITASCLEGDCTVTDEEGNEVDLPEGQETFIEEGGDIYPPFEMDRTEVEEWVEFNPEIDQFMPAPPNPEDYPDIPPEYFDAPPPDGFPPEWFSNPDQFPTFEGEPTLPPVDATLLPEATLPPDGSGPTPPPTSP